MIDTPGASMNEPSARLPGARFCHLVTMRLPSITAHSCGNVQPRYGSMSRDSTWRRISSRPRASTMPFAASPA